MKKILIIIGLILLLPAVCLAGKVNVKRLNKAKWVYFETENFKVLTDANKETALEIVIEIEHLKYFLNSVLLYEQKPLSEKVFVVASKNKASFKSIGIPADYAAGLFLSGYGNSILARCDGFRPSSKGKGNIGRHIVFHELVHLFLHNSSSELALPPWYNEGIAEYFGTYLEKNGEVIIGDISIMKDRFYSMLKSGGGFKNVDTESLFKTAEIDLYAVNTGRKNHEYINKFYARAFIVVHYLFGDIDRTKILTQYLFALKKGLSVDESFKHAFKMTFAEFDKEVNSYLNGRLTLRVYNLEKIGIKFPDVECNKHDISKRDALALLFTQISIFPDGLLGDGKYDRFIDDMEKFYPGIVDNTLQKQLAENSENRVVLLRLATTYGKMNKCRKAVDLYERAIPLEESDATMLNNYAWFLVTMSDVKLRNPVKAIKLAERAVAIERKPSFLDTLAEAYYANGSSQKAIETINEAISLTEGDGEYLNKQLKKFEEAH